VSGPASHPDPGAWARLDAVAGAERARLVGHAAACARCRARLVAEDPVSAFALLGLEEPPAERLDELSVRVAAAVDRAAGSRGRTSARTWGTLAAAGALAAVIGVAVGVRPVPVPAPPVGGPMAPVASVEPMPVPEPAGLEPLRVRGPSGEAQVVELTVGDAHVVMIFDDGLDL